MKHILIVEDEDSLRELIAFNLKKNGYQVSEVDNANDALMVINDCHFDIILLDIMLPGLNGLQFLEIIRRKNETVRIPVIIVSARNSETDIVNGLEGGADDYLTKPFSIKVLVAKVQAMFRRYGLDGEKPLVVNGISLDEKAYEVKVDGNPVSLSGKEFDLLSVFLRHPGKVFTRSQLLNNIWGYDSSVYTRTVDVHMSSLRKKLGEKGSTLVSIPKIGYRMEL